MSAKTIRALRKAADVADWEQVSLNHVYGPPCFHFEAKYGKFCLRAKTWFGHDGDPHRYVSLADLLASVAALKEAERQREPKP
jgi:hypothetical protein